MGKCPILKPREIASILEKPGFIEVRQKGSHKQYRHNDGRCTTLKYHPGEDISPLLLKQIIKDIRMTIDEFLSNR